MHVDFMMVLSHAHNKDD